MEQADHEFVSTLADEDQQIFLKDGIIVASSDGEPHEMLALIAVFSGVLVAFVILVILIILIDRRNDNYSYARKPSIFTIFGSSKSITITPLKSDLTFITVDVPTEAKFKNIQILPEITTISC